MAQDKLAAQLQRMKAQAAEQDARSAAAAEKLKKMRDERKELGIEIAALERKVRNHRLIETGALVEKILGESVEKVFLPGFWINIRVILTAAARPWKLRLPVIL